MRSSALFGRYWEGSSFIHLLDPRIKLSAVLVLVVTLFLATNWISLAFAALFICILFLVAKIPLVQAAKSVAPILFIVIIAALFNIFYIDTGDILIDWGWVKITTGGLNNAAFVGLRLILLLLLGSLLTMTTTSIDITDGMESMLSPLAKIGMPIHEFAFVMGCALRFLPQFADEFKSIRQAQLARGARLSTSPLRGVRALSSLIIPMFAGVFRHADTLALAMDARCYRGPANRTRLRPMQLGWRDGACVFALLIVVIAVVVLSRL